MSLYTQFCWSVHVCNFHSLVATFATEDPSAVGSRAVAVQPVPATHHLPFSSPAVTTGKPVPTPRPGQLRLVPSESARSHPDLARWRAPALFEQQHHSATGLRDRRTATTWRECAS